MANITFSYDDREEMGRFFTMDFQEMFWPEITEAFVSFLRGCGYVLDKQEVWEYLKEYNDEYENAVCSGRCNNGHGEEEGSGSGDL